MKADNQKDKFQVAVDYLCEYSGVKIAIVLDNEGLVVASNSHADFDTEAIAAIGLDFIQVTNQYAGKLADPNCETVSLKTAEDWIIISRTGDFYLLVLAERRVDDLISVRVQRSVEMITNYVDKKYPEPLSKPKTKTPADKKMEASYV